MELLSTIAFEADEAYENGYGDGYNEGACVYDEAAQAQSSGQGGLSSDDIPSFDWPFADPQ